MAIKVELFDGTILEFPDDTPTEVIDRTAKQVTLQKQPPKEEPGVLEQLLSAPKEVVKGAASGLVQAVGGLGALPYAAARYAVPELKPFEETSFGKAITGAEQYLAPSDEGYITQVAGGLGSLASMIGPQALLRGVGTAGRLATGLAPKAATPFALGQTSGLGIEEARQRATIARAEGEGPTPGEELAALAVGVPIGLTELLPVEKLFKGLDTGLSEGFKYTVANRVKRALQQGGIEGAQEVASGLMQDLSEKGIYNPNLEVGQSMFDELTVGGGVGAIAQAGLDILFKRRIQDAYNTTQRKKAEEELKKRTDEILKKQQEQIATTKEQLGIREGQPLMLPAPAEKIEAKEEIDPLQNPLGTFKPDQLQEGYLREVNKIRDDQGMAKVKELSIEDIADAGAPRGEIDRLISGRLSEQGVDVAKGLEAGLTMKDIENLATEKNIDTATPGFTDFVRRTTGVEGRLSPVQTLAVFESLSKLPAAPQLQILPEGTNATRFTQAQYDKAIKGIKENFLKSGNLGKTEAIQEIKDFSGLENTRDAESLLNSAIRNGDFSTVSTRNFLTVDQDGKQVGIRYTKRKDAELAAKSKGLSVKEGTSIDISLPTEEKPLPGGPDIRETTFKEGEAPEAFEIKSDQAVLATVKTEEEAAAKAERLQTLRENKANGLLGQINSIDSNIAKSQQKLESMEADGKADTIEYRQLAAKIAANNINLENQKARLNTKVQQYLAPVTVTPKGTKPVVRQGFTLFEQGKPKATFPTQQAAEEAALTGLETEQLQALVNLAPTQKGLQAKRLGKMARDELARRMGGEGPAGIKIEPTEGRTVAETEERLADLGIFTPKFKQQVDELEKKLRPVLDKLGLKDLRLNIVRAIQTPMGEADGMYAEKLVTIALNADNPIRTLRHEAIHALKELGAFTDAQWKVLEKMAKENWLAKYGIAQRYKGLTQSEQIEEAIADAFSDFDQTKPPAGLVGALFNKIKKFFDALGNAMRGMGFQTAEDVFANVEKGVKLPEGVEAAEAVVKYAKRGGEKYGIPNYIWDLYDKLERATDIASGRITPERGRAPGAAKREETMAFRRLNEAVKQEFGEDQSLKILQKLQEIRGIEKAIAENDTDLVDLYKTTRPESYAEVVKEPKYARKESRKEEPISPMEKYVTKEEAEGRVRRRQARPEGAGKPSNERTIFEKDGKKFVVGQINVKDWKERVDNTMSLEEIEDARNWYQQLHNFFEPVFGETASDYALAWLLSQQRASPTKGFTDVLRASDLAIDKIRIKKAGLNEKALVAALRKETPEGGVGAKLLDFIDSELGKSTRTVMGNAKAGRQPAAIDVWAQRDIGFVDEQVQKFVTKQFGKDAASELVLDTARFGEPQYEYGVDFYNDVASYLNRIRYLGGGWTAREAQAVGWVNMQKFMGIKPEFVRDIINGNTRRVSIGLAPGYGSTMTSRLMGKEIPVEEAQKVISDLAKAANIKITQSIDGVGAYLTYVEGSIQVDAIGSPESVDDFMDMIGYAFQQTEVINTRPLASGKNSAIDILSPSLNTQDKAIEFFTEYLKEMPKTTVTEEQKTYEVENGKVVERIVKTTKEVPIAPGFQQVKVDGVPGIRLVNFDGKWTKKQIDELAKAATIAENATGIKDAEFTDMNVVFTTTSNDWTKYPNGEKYVDSLRNRGRLQETEFLQREYAPTRFDLAGDGTINWRPRLTGPAKFALRPSTGGGIVLGEKQPASGSIVGVHYGRVPDLKMLNSASYGSGIKGAEAQRLAESRDRRIKNRVYFYTTNEGDPLPRPESGLGNNVYTQKFDNVLIKGSDEMQRLYESVDKDMNRFESAVVDEGYDGYAIPDMGMMVILNHNVPVNYQGRSFEVDPKKINYSLKVPTGFSMNDLPRDTRGNVDTTTTYTLPENTILFHGANKDRADEIKRVGRILQARPSVKTGGGLMNEGNLVWFGDEDIAKGHSKQEIDVISTALKGKKEPGEVFETITEKPYKLIGRMYKMNAEEADAVSDALQLPDYKRMKEGDSLSQAAYRAHDSSPVTPSYRTDQGRMTAPYPIILKALGYDGYFDTSGIAIIAEKGVRLGEKGARMERFSLKAPNTKEFKEWFGDSKIVNEDGTPKVMYHGTRYDVDRFKHKITFVSPSTRVANKFAANDMWWTEGKPVDEGANVMPLFVRAENPFDFENPKHVKQVATRVREFAREGGFDPYRNPGIKRMIAEIPSGSWPAIEEPLVWDAITDLGFDGAYLIEFGEKNLAVFNRNQLKSVFAEKPTLASEDIRYSLKESIDPDTATAIDRTTTTRQEEGYADRLLNSISAESRERAYAGIVNKYIGIEKRTLERAELLGDQELLADQSAIAAALFADRAAGVAASSFRNGVPVYEKGFTNVSDLNGTVKGLIPIFEPLMKYNDPYIFQMFQFYAATKRGKRLTAEGREKLFTPDDIKRGQALEAQYPEFKQAFDEYQKYNQGLVKFMKDTGVISEKEAQIWTQNWDYIPFFRQMEGDVTVGPRVFSAIAGVAKPKKLKGGEAQLADFMETVVRNARAAIEAGMKNIAAQRAVRDVLDAGLAVEVPANEAIGTDIVTVKENGITKHYRVADPMVVESMKGLNLPQLPFLDILAKPAEWLRNLVTKDPGFIMANLLRDSVQAWVTTGQNMTPVVDTFKQYGAALVNASPEVRALAQAGLFTGYDFSGDVKATAREVEKELRQRSGNLTFKERALWPLSKIWSALEKGSTASDVATRAEVYKRVLKETGNEAEALYQAMEVLNFSRRGSSAVIRILTAVVPFMNARIQGLDVLYRAGFGKMATSTKEMQQKAFMFRSMYILSLSCLYWALASDSEEYKTAEPEARDNNWIIGNVRIPIPFEIGVLFKVFPERILETAFGQDTGKDLKESIFRHLSSTLAFNPIPQAVIPIIENVANYSFFTGQSIIGKGMENVAPKFQATSGTSLFAQRVGYLTNQSPIMIDNLIRGYTGTLGTYFIMLIDAIMRGEGDPTKATMKAEQLPVIKRFFASEKGTGTITAYYDLKNQVDEATRTINFLERTGKGEDLKAYYEEKGAKLMAVKPYIQALDKDMTVLRETRQAVLTSRMDPDRKREILDNIRQAEINLTSRIQFLKKQMS